MDQPQPDDAAPHRGALTSAGRARAQLLVSWRAPGWASRSVVEDAGVQHSLPGRRCAALDDADGELELAPTLMQYDELVVEPDGVLGVYREPPIIAWDGSRLTVSQAVELGRALADLAETVAESLR